MATYNFEQIGKQKVYNDLQSKIMGKANELQRQGATKSNKLQTLKEIQQIVKDAHKILNEL